MNIEKDNTVSVSATNSICLGEALPAEFEQQFGRLNMEWGSLDYAMRLACKRLEGVGIESVRGKEIMKLRFFNAILPPFKKAVEKNQKLDVSARHELANLIERICPSQPNNLYDQRNAVLHSFWAVSPEGELVRQRVGTDEWLRPVTVTQDELGKLCDVIRTTWQRLLELTKPLLTAGQAGSVPHATQST